MNLICVPPDRAADAMPLARKYIENAIQKTNISDAEEIIKDVLNGKSLLWLAAQDKEVIGAGITMLVQMNNNKICEIIAWGTRDQTKCASLLATIEKYASDEKCKSVRLIGRKGWARTLPDYKIKSIIMEKAV